jgi:hypothetical protein
MSSEGKIPEWARIAAKEAIEPWLGPDNQYRCDCEEEIAHALLAAEQRGLEKARQSLAKAEQALKDWLSTYAPDLCDPEEVLAAQGRIGTQGTIAYIADALAAIRSLGEQQ